MRLIDADALIISLAKDRAALVNNHVQHGEICRVDETIWKVVDAPTIDAVPVVRGEWKMDTDPDDGDCRCSSCKVCIDALHKRNHGLLNALGFKLHTFYKYCPFCGAKMEKEEVCNSLQSQDDCQD